jgi:hypothetical protein
MEEHDQAVTKPARGDERRAVGKLRPGLRFQASVGFRKYLVPDRYLIRHFQTEERTALLERRKFLRRIPGQRAAEHTAAAA